MRPIIAAGSLLLATLFLTLPAAALAGDADAIIGVWDTSDKDAKIEVYKCGTEYCGRIVHLEEPNYPPGDVEGMGGLRVVDRHNPDPRLRKCPLIGLRLMQGFRYAGHGAWEGGRIYNPEDGKVYGAQISLASSHRLMLRGYWVLPLLGRTETWARSRDDPVRGYLYSACEASSEQK